MVIRALARSISTRTFYSAFHQRTSRGVPPIIGKNSRTTSGNKSLCTSPAHVTYGMCERTGVEQSPVWNTPAGKVTVRHETVLDAEMGIPAQIWPHVPEYILYEYIHTWYVPSWCDRELESEYFSMSVLCFQCLCMFKARWLRLLVNAFETKHRTVVEQSPGQRLFSSSIFTQHITGSRA